MSTAICSTNDLSPGERLQTTVKGTNIVVFNVDGEYKAYRNVCAHQGGPACEGPLVDTVISDGNDVKSVMDGYVLTCPWHGWEYDIRTGETIADIKKRLPPVEVSVQGEEVVVQL